MVKTVSRNREGNEVENLPQLIGEVTLKVFPDAVIIPCAIQNGMWVYSEDEGEMFIYTRGRLSTNNPENNRVVVRLIDGQPELLVKNMVAYQDALRLHHAYKDATKRNFELSIP